MLNTLATRCNKAVGFIYQFYGVYVSKRFGGCQTPAWITPRGLERVPEPHTGTEGEMPASGEGRGRGRGGIYLSISIYLSIC